MVPSSQESGAYVRVGWEARPGKPEPLCIRLITTLSTLQMASLHAGEQIWVHPYGAEGLADLPHGPRRTASEKAALTFAMRCHIDLMDQPVSVCPDCRSPYPLFGV